MVSGQRDALITEQVEINGNLYTVIIFENGVRYMQVKERVRLFRKEFKLWSIRTHLVMQNDGFAICTTNICDEHGNHRATGIGSCLMGDFDKFVETAETHAVGRAIENLGIITEYAHPFDKIEEELGEGKPKEKEAVEF